MKLDVVVYLLRADEEDVESLTRLQERLQELEYQRLPAAPGRDLGVPMQLWSKQNEESTPEWVEWCNTTFNIQNPPRTLTSGAVLALTTAGRTFAVTFGNGWAALPKDLIEPDFGLRVAMHLVPPHSVRNLVTKSVRLRGNETNIFNAAGADLGAFPLEPESEWLRQTGGRVGDGHGFVAVRGAASVRLVRFERGIDELPATCGRLLALFQANVPAAFKFYENLRPISPHDPKHADLEKALRRDLKRLSCDNLTLDVSRAVVERAATMHLKHAHKSHELPDLFDEHVWTGVRALKTNNQGFDVEKLKLHVKDEDGNYLLKGALLDYLQAEVSDVDGVWLRMEGNWFRATHDYVALVNRQLEVEVKDLTADLSLPDWDRADHPKELHYNTYAAAEKTYLLQDQQLVAVVGHAPLEACDLLTPDGHFIHLKDSEGSQCVGAMIGQLRAAAYMMRNHEDFRQELRGRYLAHVGADRLLELEPTFVLALARKANLSIYGKMLVAKINVLDCARRVRAFGFHFGVCRVNHFAPPRRRRTPRRR